MAFEGFTPYDVRAAEIYTKRRWWLGLTLGDMFDKACDLYPGREALVGPEKRYAWSQLREQVDRMAYNLLQEGFKRGDTVLLQLPNWPEFVISYFALQKAGLVMVLLTVNHTAREIAHLSQLTRPKGWIVPSKYRKTDFLPIIEQVRRENSNLEKVILVGEDVSPDDLKLEDLLKPHADPAVIRQTLEQARPDPGDVCQILPSGGTTGLPKGAPRTHNDYICNVEYKSLAWDINPTDTCLVVATVGHNLGLLVCVCASVFHGAKIIMQDSTYPEDFCRSVQNEKVSCTGLVPTLISRIVKYENLENFDLSSLKKIYVGAANSPPELVREVEEKLGARYINAFGMVEGPVSQSRPDDPVEVRFGTIGRPCCPYDHMVTLDVDGNKTASGVEGELAAKGPGVFTGYFNNPQANQKEFTPDGYFRTGDLATIDENGCVRITGRIKDIIIRGGENIAARDIEDAISTYSKVEYVAAVGMPDPDLGEVVCAYIKLVRGTSITLEEIVAHLTKTEASRVLYPARIEVVEEMPLTAAGKADKKILKKDIEGKLKNP
ncbi:MAG: AMP-binding protein [Deltaproteobacteria bacterium]|jgi:non-ribosomal peptide synthetase component E (peptide arylation enzyme)|nr:AMP-binding protein [Deltaproteobacteria bacterium]